MAIDDAELQHLLQLARLDLDASRADAIRADLNRVLDYVEMLEDVDVDDLEPLIRPVAVDTAFRTDEPRPSLGTESAHALGRIDDEGRFVVPRTVDEGN